MNIWSFNWNFDQFKIKKYFQKIITPTTILDSILTRDKREIRDRIARDKNMKLWQMV